MLRLCKHVGARFAAVSAGVVLAASAGFTQQKQANVTLFAGSAEESEVIGAAELADYALSDPLQTNDKSAKPTQARREPNARPWFIAGELGEGQVKLTSDQSSGSRVSTFELGFVAGHTLGSRARIGVEVNGWLLQASSLNNPTLGQSVSDVLGVLDVFPSRRVPLFFRGGVGAGLYQNNSPNGFNGHGLGWTVGGGYEIPLTERLGLAPMAGYAAGRLGDVRNSITVQTNRRYSVIEFKGAIIWHFGAPRKTDLL